MKILVLGGRGMAGHLIADYFKQATTHEIWSTVRGQPDGPRTISLDVMDEFGISALLHQIRPDIVINATGLLNKNADQKKMEAIYVNSLFPHKLAQNSQRFGFRLIHISTDCVFSGTRGNYKETDVASGTTVYAKTKHLGEIVDDTNLTVRTSIIGPELKPDGIGLFHWFMGQSGSIAGYTQVYWNGVTTLQLAKTIDWTLQHSINGLVHLASVKISKFELLTLMKEVFGKDLITIQPYDGNPSDKSLVNTRDEFFVKVPGYIEMLVELKAWMETYSKERYHHYAT